MENNLDAIELEQELLTDYRDALVHALWYIPKEKKTEDVKRYLIFGMVECYPVEIGDLPTLSEQKISYNGGKLYFVRQRLAMKEAIIWYNEAKIKESVPIFWESVKNVKCKEIRCGALSEINPWPNFVLSSSTSKNEIPFIANTWGCSRLHQLFPEKIESFLPEILQDNHVAERIKELLLWDMRMYPELLGSLNFILPNPLYRMFHERLNPDGQVEVHFQPRNCVNLDSLEVYSTERKYGGLANARKSNIVNNMTQISLLGRDEEVALMIICPSRGLIGYSQFASCIHSINIEMRLKTSERHVVVPGTNEKYKSELYESTGKVIVGENMIVNIDERLAKAKVFREQKKHAYDLGQHFFYKQQKEATEFIRELIKGATKSIILIDPYFTAIEWFKHILVVSSSSVEVKLITSALGLESKSNLLIYKKEGIKPPSKGEELYRQVKSIGQFNVWVMGTNPAAHDRFLIIDNTVWFMGNSLHTLGKRASMMIKLPDPKDIIQFKDRLLTDSSLAVDLEKWINDYKKKQKNNKLELLKIFVTKLVKKIKRKIL